MRQLDPGYRRQIERILGRPLIPEELVPADRPESLSAPVLAVARLLRSEQLALCAAYLHVLVPTRGIELQDFIGALER